MSWTKPPLGQDVRDDPLGDGVSGSTGSRQGSGTVSVEGAPRRGRAVGAFKTLGTERETWVY